MKLLNLSSSYFWVTTREFHGEEVDFDLKKKIRNEAWQIADLLRFEDSFSYTEKLLRVLMSDDYKNSIARYDEMREIINKIGSFVNPKYQNAVGKIGQKNLIDSNTEEGWKKSYAKSTKPTSMGII
jgi:hypothetical protein